MENGIRLIALDLDGTLLDPDKRIRPGDMDALERASAAGAEIVPATGRLFELIPEAVKSIPFIHFVIALNGAEVRDIANGASLFREELTVRQTLEIMDWLDGFDCVYSCYKDNEGWMERGMREVSSLYAPDVHYEKMLMERKPVDGLKDFLRRSSGSVQKVSAYFRDPEDRLRAIATFPSIFPGASLTASAVNNIEVNTASASKGDAMVKLCGMLGFPPSRAMAFGDGTNDITMLRAAGIGVAMDNAPPEVKEAADHVTLDNASCGVKAAIDRFMFGC